MRLASAGPGYSEDVMKSFFLPLWDSAFPSVDVEASFLDDGKAICTFCQNLELTS